MQLTLPHDATDRILALLDESSADERDAGERWYPDAHSLALDLAYGLPSSHRFHGDVERSSAVLARYSVQTSWPMNVRFARMAYAAAESPDTALDVIMATPTLGATRRAVARLLVAGDAVPDVIRSQKVSDFHGCILDPSDEYRAVIDRHAIAIAVGRPLVRDELSIGVKLYRATGDAYRSAAAMAGLQPLTVQAVTWVAWRNRYAAANHGHHA